MSTIKSRTHRQTKSKIQVKATADTRESDACSTHATARQADLDVTAVFAAASPQIRELVLELLNSSKEVTAQIFLTRGVRVLLDLAPSHAAVEAATASTDYGVLLSALQSSEVADKLVKADPLARAKLRGIEAKKRFLTAEGGMLSTQEVASILDISPQAINKRRRTGKLIGIAQGLNQYSFPGWQFEGNHTIAGLESILAVLRDRDPLMQVVFMLNPNDRLDGQRPLDLIRAGRLNEVITAAYALGEHGAS